MSSGTANSTCVQIFRYESPAAVVASGLVHGSVHDLGVVRPWAPGWCAAVAGSLTSHGLGVVGNWLLSKWG